MLHAEERYEPKRKSSEGEMSPKNTTTGGQKPVGMKLDDGGGVEDTGAEPSSSAAGSKGAWDDVVDLEEIQKRALERDRSFTSLQGLIPTLQQQRKTAGGMRRNRSAAEMAKRRLNAHAHTALKKSVSHTSVNKQGQGQGQGRTSVHFDLGHQRDDNEDDDGWTEASGSASPNLSRSGSVAGGNSGRNSRGGTSGQNSKAPSISTSPSANRTESRDWSQRQKPDKEQNRNEAATGQGQPQAQQRHPDATQITTRLLQRVSSQSAAPMTSTVSATATPIMSSLGQLGNQSSYSHANSEAGYSSGTATPHDLPAELISRFKGSRPGTPGESPSPFHSHLGTPSHGHRQSTQSSTQPPKSTLGNNRRAKSMSNLAQENQPTARDDSDSDRPLAPRSRKSSTSAYGVDMSRTQQKLWLQRASSQIDNANTSSVGLNLALNGLGTSSIDERYGDENPFARTLVGSIGFRDGDGQVQNSGDPRVRLVLERGGMAYRAVERFMGPVARSLRRLEQIPGSHRGKRIPKTGRTRGSFGAAAGAGAKGLSQSLKERSGWAGGGAKVGADSNSSGSGRKGVDTQRNRNAGGERRSYEGKGSLGSVHSVDGGHDELAAILRGLWESTEERQSPRRRREVDE